MNDQRLTRSRGRPRKVDPNHVLQVAMNAYWRDDPMDVSVNSICRLAGVSKPSLYRIFKNEDGLTHATLDRYAELVLKDIFELLNSGKDLRSILNALIDFVCDDPRMEVGCLFYKMRVGKHRLGSKTRARLEEFETSAQTAYKHILSPYQHSDDWPDGITVKVGARYLSEQLALASSQRASGIDSESIRKSLTLALSVFPR